VSAAVSVRALLVRLAGIVALSLAPSWPGAAQSEPAVEVGRQAPAESTVTFSASQAAAGEEAYERYCASCHGADLRGEHLAPALVGERFAVQWTGKSADVLLFHLRRMPIEPVGAPGSLPDETYADLLAYLLRENAIPSSTAALPAEAGALARLVIPAATDRAPASSAGADRGATDRGAADARGSAASASPLLVELPPVADEMLRHPAPEDWLVWHRTYDSMGWSPLEQIDRANVAKVEVAWRAPLAAGENMPSPLVHRGVMYLHTFPDTTLALDASNGRVLWRYRYQPESRSSKKMGLALHGHQLFVPTSDLHVVSYIDPATGRKTMSPAAAVSLTETHLICPTAVGARSWPPTSFNPETKRLYLPLTEGCMAGGPEGFKGLLTSGVGLTMRPHPDSSDGNMGRLQAVDLATRQLAWSYRQPTPLVSSTLATRGGVVFVADLEPSLDAFDDTTGALLWTAPLDDSPGSSLVTYAAAGRQYVALVLGQENNVSRDWTRIHRAIALERGIALADPPRGGAAIWAFALPR
jgi:glucose dehydrogenase/mono/diheme cytochrome c family protein